MPLRPYQIKALESVRKHYLLGINKQLIVMGTGTGKSLIFSNLPEYLKDILPKKTLLLVHRDELVKQAYHHFKKQNPLYNVQCETGTSSADLESADIVVASIQTLGRNNGKKALQFDYSLFDLVIIDEAHHSLSESYKRVLDDLNSVSTLVTGFTATPMRGDGQGLGSVYQKIVAYYPIRMAIEDGYLVDVKGFKISTEISLDEVHTNKGDYDQKELANTVDTPARNQLAAKAYQEHAGNRQAIGFGVNILHAKHLAEVFRSKGIKAEAVWGVDPDRHEKLEQFKKGLIQVLFNVAWMTEGVDIPSVSCIILAAPTKSGVVFSQRVGRGTRLFEGKKDCIILDLVDSTTRHNLITLPTLLGLPAGLNLKGRGLVESAKLIEEALKAKPKLDPNKILDIDKLDSYVEEVDLFATKLPTDVEQNSTFTWYPSYDGGYRLLLPNKDEIKIKQNLLDIFEVYGTLKGKKYRGERPNISEAFAAADSLVTTYAPDYLKVIRQEETWHKELPTEPQLKYLRKIFKGKEIPATLTRGEAHKLLSAHWAGKEDKRRKYYGRCKRKAVQPD